MEHYVIVSLLGVNYVLKLVLSPNNNTSLIDPFGLVATFDVTFWFLGFALCLNFTSISIARLCPSRVLIGSSELLVCEGRSWSPEAPSWSRIPLPPPIYLTQNWPLRLAHVNATGEWLLVTGKWGVALYGTRFRRWRLFGNVQHERSLYTEGLPIGWYSHSVFFVCFRNAVGISAGIGLRTKVVPASKSDASRSSALEQAIRRKTLHKPSVVSKP